MPRRRCPPSSLSRARSAGWESIAGRRFRQHRPRSIQSYSPTKYAVAPIDGRANARHCSKMSVLRLSVRHADALDEMVYYLIETPDGAVGVFDGCERDEHGRPTVLLVAQGWFGRRRFEIPVQKIIEVDHGRRRIVLARGAAPLDRSLVQRLSEIGRRGPGEGGVADSRLEGKSGRAVLCGVDGSGRVESRSPWPPTSRTDSASLSSLPT